MSKKRKIIVIVLSCLLICAAIGVWAIGFLFTTFSFPKDQTADMAKERFNSFYALPKNSLDAVYIGSSSVDRYWIPSLAYQNYGIAVYGLSSGNQPAVFAKYLIKEAEKRHDPDLYIIDIRGTIRFSDSTNQTDIRRVTDNMRLSVNRHKAVKAVLDYVGQGETEINTEDKSYYYPPLKYYAQYRAGEKTIYDEDLANPRPESEYLGYFAYNGSSYKQREQDYPNLTSKTGDIPDLNKENLNDLLDYCDTLDAEVLFLTSPQSIEKKVLLKHNYVFKVIEERGYDTINFNTSKMYKKLRWDFEEDLYNPGHANIWGAVKYTNYLGSYIQKKYDLPDHREDGGETYNVFIDAHKALIEKASEHDSELKKLLTR